MSQNKPSVYPAQYEHLPELTQQSLQKPEKQPTHAGRAARNNVQPQNTKLPARLQNVTDCNELRHELLTLMKQGKEMEFRLRKERQVQDQIAKQLVQETERPNEDILSRKRAAKYSVEKQIEQMKAKTAAIRYVDQDAAIDEINDQYERDAEFYEFCANAPLVRKLLGFLLTEVQLQKKQQSLQTNLNNKQQQRYHAISSLVSKEAEQEYTDVLKKYNRAFERRSLRMQQLNEYLKEGFSLEDSIISDTYKQRMNEIDVKMQKTDPRYVEFLKAQGFDVKYNLELSGSQESIPVLDEAVDTPGAERQEPREQPPPEAPHDPYAVVAGAVRGPE